MSSRAAGNVSVGHPQGQTTRVLPGDFYVTGEKDQTIVTVLGSCVAACIRNPATGFGGLNHFMLPESDTDQWNGASRALRYGNFAMEALINAVLKSGCARSDLEVKLFGGANLHGSKVGVGAKNAAFARHYIEAEGLHLVSSDLGGDFGRRIHFNPVTGKVQRLLLKDRDQGAVVRAESRYGRELVVEDVGGGIDLFD
ncbi:MAG: chemoreceptor glutamine deamidase CheD [Proteobacteria bacterium]|nr:chemoreceptor glutamine deamidase CheD [Pseudomonadota bacterium]